MAHSNCLLVYKAVNGLASSYTQQLRLGLVFMLKRAGLSEGFAISTVKIIQSSATAPTKDADLIDIVMNICIIINV